MPDKPIPEWERLLSSAAHLQRIVPGAVHVGGTAAATYAHHRLSVDHYHVLTDLRERFDAILEDLESVAGWQTARVRRPVLILGSLDGIETGVRQLIRSEPLETTVIEAEGAKLTVPTKGEMFRIKAVLALKRKAEVSAWTKKFNALLDSTESRNDEPYKFNRADAYEPEVAFA